MAGIVTPRVFLIAETKLNYSGAEAYLSDIGVPDWNTDATSDAEALVEMAGKSCYMSFDTSLNKNLTKTGTRDNYHYIQEGIIGVKHGSCLEHATVTFSLVDVSRILTHELVRHRHGAYSQQSGRYVRLDYINMWLPSCIAENEEATLLFLEAMKAQEEWMHKLSEIYKIDELTARGDFPRKKELTSAFRRLIGNGQANNIQVTYNHRALRHILETRMSRHAEEEIRLVAHMMLELVKDKYPAIYGDVSYGEEFAKIPEAVFTHSKV